MDTYIVSARKYRPAKFEDVVGQGLVTQTLQNAIKNGKVAQAFLFCGPRGVGKTTCARILAKVLNTNEGLDENSDFAFNIFELDAASNNSVDDIRQLNEKVRIPPQVGKYKIYIIDEVHMLTTAAFNAFLKTLEEPPPHAIFILATTEKHKIIPTILSRCQIFDFSRITIDDIANHLQNICAQEGITFDKEGLHLVAEKADGALRDALSLFDKVVSSYGKNVTLGNVLENLNILDYDYFFKLTYAFMAQNKEEVLNLLDEILQKGFESQQVSHGLAEHFRDLLVSKEATTLHLLEKSEGLKTQYKDQATQMPTSFLITGLDILNHSNIELRQSKNKRLQTEIALLKLCYMSELLGADKLLGNLPATEKKTLVAKPTPPPIAVVETPVTKESLHVIETPKIEEEPIEETPSIELVQEVEEEIPTISEKPKVLTEEAIENIEPIPEPMPIVQNNPSESASKPEPNYNKPQTTNLNASDIGAKYNMDLSASMTANTEVEEEVLNMDSTWPAGEFEAAWKSYLTALSERGKALLGEALKNISPTTKGNGIYIVFPTAVLVESFKEEAEELKHFMVNNTSMKRVLVQYDFDKSNVVKPNNLPLTTEEKYNAMVEENPLLEEFRQKFNLKVDY